MNRFLLRLRGQAIAILALCVALGGTSYAAVKVSGKQIKNNSVTGADLKNNSVTGKDVKNGSLSTADLAKGTLLQGPQGQRGERGLQGEQGPQGERGPAGPTGEAFSTFHDDAINAPDSPAAIVTMDVPSAGAYVIVANATVFIGTSIGEMDCALTAVNGGSVDSDRQLVDRAGFHNMTSTVVHDFLTPGTATWSCTDSGAMGDLSNIKITAVPVGGLTNTPF